MERMTEDTGHTLALAIALWIGAIAAVTASGILAEFDAAERSALGAFGAIFALAAYKLDEEMGRFVRGARGLAGAESFAQFDAGAFDGAMHDVRGHQRRGR